MPLVQVDLFNRAKQSKEPYFKIEKTEYQKFFNVRWQSYQGSRENFREVANKEWKDVYRSSKEQRDKFYKKEEIRAKRKAKTESNRQAFVKPKATASDKSSKDDELILVESRDGSSVSMDELVEKEKTASLANSNTKSPELSKNVQSLVELLDILVVPHENIISDDITSNSTFLQLATSFLIVTSKFKSHEQTWKNRERHRRFSALRTSTDIVNATLLELADQFKQLGSIKVDPHKVSLCQAEKLKEGYKSDILKLLSNNMTLHMDEIKSTTSRLRIRNTQYTQYSSRDQYELSTKFVKLCDKSWEDSFSELGADTERSSSSNLITKLQLQTIGSVLRDTNSVPAIVLLRTADIQVENIYKQR